MRTRTLVVIVAIGVLIPIAAVAQNEKKSAPAQVKMLAMEGNLPPLQFNPKELSVDKSVPWQQHASSEGDDPTLEFTAAEGRVLSFELFFDVFEDEQNVYTRHVQPIERYAQVNPNLKRPPMVQLTWGPNLIFRGVVSSVRAKYTLFLSDGTPARATVTITLKEASSATARPREPEH